MSIFESSEHLPPARDDTEAHRQTTTWLTAFATCLNERGWTSIAVVAADTPNVALDLAGIDGQYAAFNADGRACAEVAGPSPTPPAHTVAYAESKYTDRIRLKKCLEANGYEVSEPPTKESFTDSVVNGSRTWDPVEDIGNAAAAGTIPFISMENLYELCPWE